VCRSKRLDIEDRRNIRFPLCAEIASQLLLRVLDQSDAKPLSVPHLDQRDSGRSNLIHNHCRSACCNQSPQTPRPPSRPDREIEGQGKARREESRAKPQKGRTRPVVQALQFSGSDMRRHDSARPVDSF
jgi:hypothetical protein